MAASCKEQNANTTSRTTLTSYENLNLVIIIYYPRISELYGFGNVIAEMAITGATPPDREPLLPQQSAFLNFKNRPYRDVAWLVAYLIFLIASATGGVLSLLRR